MAEFSVNERLVRYRTADDHPEILRMPVFIEFAESGSASNGKKEEQVQWSRNNPVPAR